MAIKFSKEEVALINSTINLVNEKDRKSMQTIVSKIQKINKDYKSNTKKASERILEIRKDDRWYGRGPKVVQTHFNTVARKIKMNILSGKSKEARLLYETLKEEAKFPRYKLQFENAVNEYLTSLDIEFLKGGN